MEDFILVGTFQLGTYKYDYQEEEIGELTLSHLDLMQNGVHASKLVEIELDGHTFVREDIALEREITRYNMKLVDRITEK